MSRLYLCTILGQSFPLLFVEEEEKLSERPTGGTQLGAPYISYVSVPVVEEVMEYGCCGDVGFVGEDLLGLWDTADGSSFLQLLGTNVVVF